MESVRVRLEDFEKTGFIKEGMIELGLIWVTEMGRVPVEPIRQQIEDMRKQKVRRWVYSAYFQVELTSMCPGAGVKSTTRPALEH